MVDTIYDLEVYPNFFLAQFLHEGADHCGVFEISERRNDVVPLVNFVLSLERMVGFNNDKFDYPILHWLIGAVRSGEAMTLTTAQLNRRLFELCEDLIKHQSRDYYVWDSDKYVPQIDLMRLHHLDNKSRLTSLKALEFAMRSPRIIDLPIKPGTTLTRVQMDDITRYGINDVVETARFKKLSEKLIAFRETLGPGFLSASDASIGKRIMKRELEAAAPGCTKRVTFRDFVNLSDVILPYVQFQTDTFGLMLNNFKSITIPALQVKKAFAPQPVFFGGLFYAFGLGGLHSSLLKTYVEANDHWQILDVDVTSYYPSLAIKNGLRPAHLGETFTRIYTQIFKDRQKHAKGTPENAALKLALNAVFGDSGSVHSIFYDIAFMLGITVNGQLLLCMLAEALCLAIPELRVVQANTDGLTLIFPRFREPLVKEVMNWWQAGTQLTLEAADYKRMWLRDVNSYLVERSDGKMKRIGAYDYQKPWWKDHSMLAVPRATEAHLTTGANIREWLADRLVTEPYDFMIRGKVTGKSTLAHAGLPIQKTVRYYMSTSGGSLEKQMPPLKGKDKIRITKFHDGHPVTVRNEYNGEPLINCDLEWYAHEVEKLTKGFKSWAS